MTVKLTNQVLEHLAPLPTIEWVDVLKTPEVDVIDRGVNDGPLVGLQLGQVIKTTFSGLAVRVLLLGLWF